MPDIDAWLGAGTSLADENRAGDTARTIADKPSTIVVLRRGVALPAQVVRIDTAGSPAVTQGENTTMARTMAIVLGYKNHATIADTDLERSDRFMLDGVLYDVRQILPSVPDRLIALAEAVER